MAAVEMENLNQIVSPVKNIFTDLINAATEQNYLVDITINDIQLKGNIKGIYDDKLVLVSWSKNETKYLLEAYINYLVLCASGLTIKLYFISYIKNSVYTATSINKATALKKLAQLINLYIEGHQKIIPFDPNFKIKPSEIEAFDINKFESVLKEKFDNYYYPCTDTYMNKEYANGFFNTDTVMGECKDSLLLLLAPLLELFPEYYS